MFIKIYYDPYAVCSKSGGKLLLAIMVLIVVKSLILNSRLLFYFALRAYKNLIYIFLPARLFHPAHLTNFKKSNTLLAY